jgi:hypothetical protein
LDLDNFNHNASSLKSDDSVGNSDGSVNNQGVQIDCEETQQDDDETQEGEFGLNEDGHWHRLVPSDQQMMNMKVVDMCVKGSQVYTKYSLKNIRYFVFLKLFILEATCYNLKNLIIYL